MADGTEIRHEGAGVEPAALREFVVRSMSALGSFWDATHWSEDALAVAFEKRLPRAWMLAANSAPTGPGNS